MNFGEKIIEFLKIWLPTAIVITALCGLVYLVVQQEMRTAANDPQIQIAEDTARALETGKLPAEVIPADKVEISKSLSPFLMIFDDSDHVTAMASSAILDGELPILPPGLLEYVKAYGQDRVTWQPREGVRSALVIERFSGVASGYVVAGRSLREVEIRETNVLHEAALVWVLAIFATLVISTFLVFFNFKRKEK